MSDTSYYKNLKVWQKSIDLIEQVYKITALFPKIEVYGLSDQLRRASVSIASNIAEWSWRNTETDYLRFLHIAKWSALELDTQITIAKRLQYIDDIQYSELDTMIIEIIKMIWGFIEYKKSNQSVKL